MRALAVFGLILAVNGLVPASLIAQVGASTHERCSEVMAAVITLVGGHRAGTAIAVACSTRCESRRIRLPPTLRRTTTRGSRFTKASTCFRRYRS